MAAAHSKFDLQPYKHRYQQVERTAAARRQEWVVERLLPASAGRPCVARRSPLLL